MIPVDVAARFRRSNDQQALDGVARQAREFREWLRRFVTRHLGKSLTPAVAKELGLLNDLLAKDNGYPTVEAAGGALGLRLRRARRWQLLDKLLCPVATDAAASAPLE